MNAANLLYAAGACFIISAGLRHYRYWNASLVLFAAGCAFLLSGAGTAIYRSWALRRKSSQLRP